MLEKYQFVDRPNQARIKATSEEYHDIDENLVLNFLDFQWTYRDMQKQYDTLFDSFGLTESRFLILMFLKRANEHMLLPSQISEKLGASRPTVSKLLKAMEQKGLVEKQESVKDGRSSYFKMTIMGGDTLKTFMPHNFEAVKIIFGQLSKADHDSLKRLLAAINMGTETLRKEGTKC